jgi:methionine synthase I (cobalamin-dependent)
VLVCDGAMGTMLYAKGVFINKSFDALNVTQPDLVAEVHQEYVRAGADIIETNTFGANRIKLGSFGMADKLHAINAQGAKIARHAAREQTYVAAPSARSASASSRGARPASTRRGSTSASRRRRWRRVASICSCSRRSAT